MIIELTTDQLVATIALWNMYMAGEITEAQLLDLLGMPAENSFAIPHMKAALLRYQEFVDLRLHAGEN